MSGGYRNYYDIDDILIKEELVPVLFHMSANGVKVDPSAEKDSLSSEQTGTWWRTRQEIQSDAANVDLRSRCPYFYKFGCKIAPLTIFSNNPTIGKMLLSTFQMRYKEILTKAHTSAASKFLTVLTKEETNLYASAQSSMAAFKKWRPGGPRFQRASVLGRKRKPID